MRRYLFNKAKYLLPHTKKTGESQHQIILDVGEYQVIIKYRNHDLILLCTCTHGSLRPGRLCSHKIAALSFLSNEKTNRKTEESLAGDCRL